jgi:hypothetical protein
MSLPESLVELFERVGAGRVDGLGGSSKLAGHGFWHGQQAHLSVVACCNFGLSRMERTGAMNHFARIDLLTLLYLLTGQVLVSGRVVAP